MTFQDQPGAPGGLKFAELEARIRELFELPAGTNLKVTYFDSDNDLVTMRNDADLKDACVLQGLNPLRLKVVAPLQVQKELGMSINPFTISPKPIIGHRYRSTMRNNYDLCSNCLAKVGNGNGEFADPPDAATLATLERMRQEQELANLQSMIFLNEAKNAISMQGARGAAVRWLLSLKCSCCSPLHAVEVNHEDQIVDTCS
ncbi:hypothetical protein R1sor_008670 [Riccia sorocarpa]|uniref:PB1 domain-containing protein n=1 Tax=Riccia sorocarpa TaxID=122646 RepID=A0ABD3HW90_9MARC